jgi:hypothetical protein
MAQAPAATLPDQSSRAKKQRKKRHEHNTDRGIVADGVPIADQAQCELPLSDLHAGIDRGTVADGVPLHLCWSHGVAQAACQQPPSALLANIDRGTVANGVPLHLCWSGGAGQAPCDLPLSAYHADVTS